MLFICYLELWSTAYNLSIPCNVINWALDTKMEHLFREISYVYTDFKALGPYEVAIFDRIEISFDVFNQTYP